MTGEIKTHPLSEEIYKDQKQQNKYLVKMRRRFVVVFLLLSTSLIFGMGRVFYLGLKPQNASIEAYVNKKVVERGNILDNYGVILATNLVTQSLYIESRKLKNPKVVVGEIAKIIPYIDVEKINKEIDAKRNFIWISRDLSPQEQKKLYQAGIIGLNFKKELKRVYPHENVLSHVLGYTNIDEVGLSGIEFSFDDKLSRGENVSLSVDIRIQSIIHQKLMEGVNNNQAIGGSAYLANIKTGEILSMVSYPDFNPNMPAESSKENLFNRVTQGVYEQGSTFKALSIAILLDSASINEEEEIDVSIPYKSGKFIVNDLSKRHKSLNPTEILMYSSNVGMSYLSDKVDESLIKNYLKRWLVGRKISIELPEKTLALVKEGYWGRAMKASFSYGYGVSMSPFQLSNILAGILNKGEFVNHSILKNNNLTKLVYKDMLDDENTSKKLLAYLRLVNIKGTGQRADVKGLCMAGKTGTARKFVNGEYVMGKVYASYFSIFPSDNPTYIIHVAVDEPTPNKFNSNIAGGGTVAAPIAKKILQSIAPILGYYEDMKLVNLDYNPKEKEEIYRLIKDLENGKCY